MLRDFPKYTQQSGYNFMVSGTVVFEVQQHTAQSKPTFTSVNGKTKCDRFGKYIP